MRNMWCKNNRLLLSVLLIAFTLPSFSRPWKEKRLDIIPEPVEIKFAGRDSVGIFRDVEIYATDASVVPSTKFLANHLYSYLGIPSNVIEPATSKKKQKEVAKPSSGIYLRNLNNGEVSGGYTLTVSPEGLISIEGNDAPGVFYGMQTLIQLLPTRAGNIPYLPTMKITDYPRFTYRGMHLDVARHFFPAEYVKRYIDFLAYHKLNYFHWHLTDDQGWRIEMKSRPALTEKGSMRDGEILGFYPGVYQPLPYNAYYTQDEIRDVVAYAADRYITVIPEIDIPGHCMSAIASYPEIGLHPDSVNRCALTWGIYNKFSNVLAPKEETFRFLDDVFTELCDLFPGEYIHVGGDECAKKWWQTSNETQNFMRENNIADEKSLQSYFIHYVQDIISKKGKTLIGWDEVLEGGVNPNCVIMNWHRAEYASRALKAGHPVIVGNNNYYYLNCRESRTQPVMGARGPLSTETVYCFDPVPTDVTADEQARVMGVQGYLWTEYIPTTWKVEYSLFPRMAALAETAWSPSAKKDWLKFTSKIEKQCERYDLLGIRYSDTFFRVNDITRPRAVR